MRGESQSISFLQRVRMFNTRMWDPTDLLILGTILFIRHLSLGFGNPALAINESEWVESGHYEGKVLSTGSVNLPHLVSLLVWGIVPDPVLRSSAHPTWRICTVNKM